MNIGPTLLCNCKFMSFIYYNLTFWWSVIKKKNTITFCSVTPDCNYRLKLIKDTYTMDIIHFISITHLQWCINCNYIDLSIATVIKLVEVLTTLSRTIIVVTDQRINGNFRYLDQKSNWITLTKLTFLSNGKTNN